MTARQTPFQTRQEARGGAQALSFTHRRCFRCGAPQRVFNLRPGLAAVCVALRVCEGGAVGGLFLASKVIHRPAWQSPRTITSGLLSHSGNFDQFLYSPEPAFWRSSGGALAASEGSC